MDASAAAPKRRDGKRKRKNDPSRTKADILEVAAEEFSTHGLSGARVDAIAERTRTSKRMIYYYFQDKETLYRAVLENAYSAVRAIEAKLDLETQPPEAALRSLVEQTFENDDANEAFIRLVAIENIHRGEHLSQLGPIREINKGVIAIIERILARGRAAGAFRADLDAIDLHMAISALCFFRVSNKHTFGKIFKIDLTSPARRAKHKRMAVEAILRLVRQE
ncbi:TetR/AcrR family transcriptional regulator [Bradyrhizobium sp.]|uniref:TetR/AcrR family transcriptional regulator n=1 Tax=Bradyrhizobium sp. TaxID=376 RepID=UPI0025BDFF0D|nr:TetR/AcrR family transcriptional regulator [Bradyrhizobium sp.]MBV8920922.1 TetR family transcriptional regulator [Bradyrhizobium sp.]